MMAQLCGVQESFGLRNQIAPATEEIQMKRLFCILRVASSHRSAWRIRQGPRGVKGTSEASEETNCRQGKRSKVCYRSPLWMEKVFRTCTDRWRDGVDPVHRQHWSHPENFRQDEGYGIEKIASNWRKQIANRGRRRLWRHLEALYHAERAGLLCGSGFDWDHRNLKTFFANDIQTLKDTVDPVCVPTPRTHSCPTESTEVIIFKPVRDISEN